MLDLSDGIARDAGAPGGALRLPGRRSTSTACRSPPGAEPDDLAFGEDYELLAAVEEPDGFPVIGRCEEGEGVRADPKRRIRRTRLVGTFPVMD